MFPAFGRIISENGSAPFLSSHFLKITEKGVEFKGRSLRDSFGGFDSFGGSGEHLALLCLSYKIQHSGGLAVWAVMAVSVMTATPLKLNPPLL